MDSFASVADLGSKWANLTGDALADVEMALEESEVLIRAVLGHRGIDVATIDPKVLRLVSVRTVRRAMPSDSPTGALPPGLDSHQIGVGPFQSTFKFPSGGTGQVYLGKTEYDLLGLNTRRNFVLDMLPDGWVAP